MVYKKYITKNGKVYGPYFYQSRRIDGKVVSEYHGTDGGSEVQKAKKILPVIIISVLLLGVIGFFIFQDKRISGNAVFGLEGNLIDGELSNGKLNLILTEGEMIPADSKIIFENNGSIQEYPLKDFLAEETELGSFYLKDSGFSGEGEGYGLIGEKEIFPVVNFELTLLKGGDTQETPSGGNTQETPSEENTGEKKENETPVEPSEENTTSEENQIETPNETNEEKTDDNPQEEIPETPSEEVNSKNKNEGGSAETNTAIEENSQTEADSSPKEETKSKAEEKTDSSPKEETKSKAEEKTDSSEKESSEPSNSESSPQESSAPITGNAVSNVFGSFFNFLTGFATNENSDKKTVSGEVSKEKDFKIDAKDAEIISGSIKSNGETLPESTIILEKDGESVIVKTEYSITEKGYGESYTGEKTKTFSLDLTKLNKTLTSGTVNIKIVYSGNEIASFSEEVTDETLEDEEEPFENLTEIFNMTNVTEIPEILNFTEELTQSEKNLILFHLNESLIKTEVNKYQNRYLVELTLGSYNAEYSYSESLTDEELKYYMERDRYLWLKDIANKLQEKRPSVESVGNLSGDFEI